MVDKRCKFEDIHITIFGNPVTKKNSQRILKNKKTGRNFIAPSAKYVQYEKDAWPYLSRFMGRNVGIAVNVKCVFYMETHRRCDLTNLLEAVDDILVHYHVVSDDCSTIIAGHDGSRVRYDKQYPRVEIEITDISAMGKDYSCKFRSQMNCDFCSFHSECHEAWKEGDEK